MLVEADKKPQYFSKCPACECVVEIKKLETAVHSKPEFCKSCKTGYYYTWWNPTEVYMSLTGQVLKTTILLFGSRSLLDGERLYLFKNQDISIPGDGIDIALVDQTNRDRYAEGVCPNDLLQLDSLYDGSIDNHSLFDYLETVYKPTDDAKWWTPMRKYYDQCHGGSRPNYVAVRREALEIIHKLFPKIDQ